MLLHPLAENTLKFPQNLSNKLERSRLGNYLENSVGEARVAPRKMGCCSCSTRTGFWASLVLKIFQLLICFCPQKSEQSNTKNQLDFWFPLFPSNSATNPKLGIQNSNSSFWFFLGDLVRPVA